jgi:N-methylhydantoinase A
MGLLVTVDNGGKLTDLCAFDGKQVLHAKTLTMPHDLTGCLFNGLTALADQIFGDDDLLRLVPAIAHLRYSTTQGTNAVVQRKGRRLGVLTSQLKLIDEARAHAPDHLLQLVDERIGVTRDLSDHQIAGLATDLVADGANRILVVQEGAFASAQESAIKRCLYHAFPRHLLGAVPLLFATELRRFADRFVDDGPPW